MGKIRERLEQRLKAALEACVGSAEYAGSSPAQQRLLVRQARLRAFRQFVDAEREQLRQQTLEQPGGLETARLHAEIFDSLIAAMYAVAQAEAREVNPAPPGGDAGKLAVAAVGGYGRAQLSPFSDIDVVFIPSHEGHPQIDATVREIYRMLVDTLDPRHHPKVSHSYRPFSDLNLLDHQTLTALMEARFLAGDEHLFQHFMYEVLRQINPVSFVYETRRERAEVWRDRSSSLYAVEPEIKNGPGGLRDFHAAVWIAKITHQISEWDVLGELQRRWVLSGTQCSEVLEALEFLQAIRNWLHFRRGQRLDTLHVEYQGELARTLGYVSDGERSAEERFMQDYYTRARTIADFSRRMIRQCDHARLPLGEGFWVQAGILQAGHEGIFRENPARLIRAFEFAQRYRLAFSLELEELIRREASLIDARLQRNPDAAASFWAILSSPGDVAGTLRAMLEQGVLERYLPEVGVAMPLIPFDPAHDYSIGEHSLRIVEELQALRDGIDPEAALLREVFAQVTEPALLYLAALLHDVGKARRQGDHSEVGADLARGVAMRLGLGEDRIARLEFLIREHLLMPRTARLWSLALPETIERFVDRIPTQDSLDMLYLLSYTDIKAVGERVLRDTDKRLLQELYLKARREWERRASRLEGDAAALEQARVRRRVARELSLRDLPEAEVEAHLQAMPPWYAVNTPPAVIARHLEYVQRVPVEHVVTDFYHERQAHYTEMTVCTWDRLGLLRDIAGALTANNIDIYLVQMDVRRDGRPISISHWWIDDYGQPVSEVKRSRVVEDLQAVLRDGLSVSEVLKRRGKRLASGIRLQALELRNDISRQHTVVQVRATDQIGLLYLLCAAMVEEGLDIATAKVTTWRGGAEDAFYVTDPHGAPLTDENCRRVAERLRARLSGGE
jgi:[protein-PII] uridylyltransferase